MLKNLETQRLDDERRFDRQYVIEALSAAGLIEEQLKKRQARR